MLILRDQPVAGARVLLVSCGAEETLQDGIRGFMTRHAHELEPGRTFIELPRQNNTLPLAPA